MGLSFHFSSYFPIHFNEVIHLLFFHRIKTIKLMTFSLVGQLLLGENLSHLNQNIWN
jgi:hypothetical protein